VYLKSTNSMAVSGLHFIGWHQAGCFAPPMLEHAEKSSHFILVAPISGSEAQSG